MDVLLHVQYPDLKRFALWGHHSVLAQSQEFSEIRRLIILALYLTLPNWVLKSYGPLGGTRKSVLLAAK